MSSRTISHFLTALDQTATHQQPLPDLSPRGHVLLPVAILAISLLSIAFSHFAQFFGTLWPANAIMLIALLCHRRKWNNYASIIFGGSAAMTIAARTANDSLGLCLVLTAANILEIATACWCSRSSGSTSRI